MRCLTLADALRSEGVESHFICREHAGHLLEVIRKRGHQAYSLPFKVDVEKSSKNCVKLSHANWLGATQQEDAQQCIDIIKIIQPDWLIVDHYAIDVSWEKTLRPYCKKIMVIDDLADRRHDCDILLDQNYGRDEKAYIGLINKRCILLCGPKYSLLRPQFSEWREYSLRRRNNSHLEHVLINLGGVDKDNVTTNIIRSLRHCSLSDNCKVTIVMGATAPWIEIVRTQAEALSWETQVKSGVNNMAELMANSDLAIGAAGSTIWERFCLGLPTILIVIAENQEANLSKVKPYHISSFRKDDPDLRDALVETINQITSNYTLLESNTALIKNLVDGQGVIRISQILSKE
jgi:UDP-2,4-diacetamido-2,4,6-trideoxy-beta-L-altropyranose hydrolase